MQILLDEKLKMLVNGQGRDEERETQETRT